MKVEADKRARETLGEKEVNPNGCWHSGSACPVVEYSLLA